MMMMTTMMMIMFQLNNLLLLVLKNLLILSQKLMTIIGMIAPGWAVPPGVMTAPPGAGCSAGGAGSLVVTIAAGPGAAGSAVGALF